MTRLRLFVQAVILSLGLAGFPCLAHAAPLGDPSGPLVLTVSGKIGVTNKGATATFDRAMFESVGMVSFTTNNPWDKMPTKYEGVPLAKLMDLLGAKGEKLTVIALNDYSADVPVEDIRKYNVILALKRNDEYLTVRYKGPLFVMYPFDSDADLRTQKFYSRAVWQVSRIEVK